MKKNIFLVMKVFSNWEDPEGNGVEVCGVFETKENAERKVIEEFKNELDFMNDNEVQIETIEENKNILTERGDVEIYIEEKTIEEKKEKIYIEELNDEELKKVYVNNEKFSRMIFAECYEMNMEQQEELSEEFFGKKFHEYLDVHDHYSSFYLRIKDTNKFFENLNLNNSCYLSEEDSKKYIELYEQVKKYYSCLERSDDKNNFYEELIEKACKEILNILEKELHELENINDEDIIEYFIDNKDAYNNFYILEKTTFTLYRDVTECLK